MKEKLKNMNISSGDIDKFYAIKNVLEALDIKAYGIIDERAMFICVNSDTFQTTDHLGSGEEILTFSKFKDMSSKWKRLKNFVKNKKIHCTTYEDNEKVSNIAEQLGLGVKSYFGEHSVYIESGIEATTGTYLMEKFLELVNKFKDILVTTPSTKHHGFKVGEFIQRSPFQQYLSYDILPENGGTIEKFDDTRVYIKETNDWFPGRYLKDCELVSTINGFNVGDTISSDYLTFERYGEAELPYVKITKFENNKVYHDGDDWFLTTHLDKCVIVTDEMVMVNMAQSEMNRKAEKLRLNSIYGCTSVDLDKYGYDAMSLNLFKEKLAQDQIALTTEYINNYTVSEGTAINYFDEGNKMNGNLTGSMSFNGCVSNTESTEDFKAENLKTAKAQAKEERAEYEVRVAKEEYVQLVNRKDGLDRDIKNTKEELAEVNKELKRYE